MVGSNRRGWMASCLAAMATLCFGRRSQAGLQTHWNGTDDCIMLPTPIVNVGEQRGFTVSCFVVLRNEWKMRVFVDGQEVTE